MRELRRRLEHLEHPHGGVRHGTRRSFQFLKACYEVLSRIDGEAMPSEAELWAWAEVEARAGQPPGFTRALVRAWAEEGEW